MTDAPSHEDLITWLTGTTTVAPELSDLVSLTPDALTDAARSAVERGAAAADVRDRLVATGDLGPLGPTPAAGRLPVAAARLALELAARCTTPEAEGTAREEPGPDDAEITVVVTTHDVGPWISQTLQSLADQDDVALDVLVVDDHSSDETLALVHQARAAGAPLRVVRTHLRGGAHARNVGAALATAPYLAFCDGDDLVAPGAYRRLVDAARSCDAPLAIGGYLKFRPAETWAPPGRWAAYTTTATHESIGDAPQLINHRACWNKVYLTRWWRDQGFLYPEVVRSNDIVPILASYLAASPVTVVADPVYLYRERPGRSSMSSRVGTEASLSSYLEQELACSRMVAAHGDRRIIDAFSDLFLREDGWVQISRYIQSAHTAGEEPSPDVLTAVCDLVATLEPQYFTTLPLAPRLMFAAAAIGRHDLTVAGALVDPKASADVRAAGWSKVLQTPWPDDPRMPNRSDLWPAGIRPTLDDVLDGADFDAVAAGTWLSALLRSLEQDPVLRDRLASTDPVVGDAAQVPDTERLVTLLESIRASSPYVTRVRRPGRSRLTISGRHDSSSPVHALVLFDEATGSTATLPATVDGEAWTVEVRRRDLERAGRYRLIAQLAGSSAARSVHVRRELLRPIPTVRRRDALDLVIDIGPANVALFARAAVARRVPAALARRLRRGR